MGYLTGAFPLSQTTQKCPNFSDSRVERSRPTSPTAWLRDELTVAGATANTLFYLVHPTPTGADGW